MNTQELFEQFIKVIGGKCVPSPVPGMAYTAHPGEYILQRKHQQVLWRHRWSFVTFFRVACVNDSGRLVFPFGDNWLTEKDLTENLYFGISTMIQHNLQRNHYAQRTIE